MVSAMEMLSPPRSKGLLVVRGLLVGLGAMLGIVLLAQGYVVIGGVLVVMATLRVVMMVQLRRQRAWRMARREQFVARRRQRRTPPTFQG